MHLAYHQTVQGSSEDHWEVVLVRLGGLPVILFLRVLVLGSIRCALQVLVACLLLAQGDADQYQVQIDVHLVLDITARHRPRSEAVAKEA